AEASQAIGTVHPFSTVRGGKWSLLNVPLGDRRRLGLSFAVITTLLILTALMSLNFWLQSGSDIQPQQQRASDISTEKSIRSLVTFTPPKPTSHKLASRRTTRTRPRNTIAQKALTISTWRSPTALFMDSPLDPVFKSLPNLNQSVKEMESFLPNNDVKESKQ
ncbi:MAG TPA: hypothetical protein VF074_04330, partial [Pyrinomonadaceae bacterium]